MKTEDLIGEALNWAVGKAIPSIELFVHPDFPYVGYQGGRWSPSTDWGQGGPIIERERIECTPPTRGSDDQTWMSVQVDDENIGHLMVGPTPLIAAMRCLVATKLGEEIDVPEVLLS